MYQNKYINSFTISLFIIFIFCIVFFVSGYGRFGMFFIDTSREAYIPMAMNKGAVLYKDIYNVYSPLGYQINALLYYIFGENLRTLYFAGLVNCFIFLSGFFFLARQFFKESKIMPLFITLFIISGFTYAISLFNYILPYSYSMVYAMSAFTWALLFLIKYMEDNKDKYILLSFFFFGMSISFKYEYILFALVLLCIPFIIRKSLKVNLLCILCFLLVPMCSILSLIIQGCRMHDFLSAFNYMLLLAKAQSVKACYQTMGLIPGAESIKNLCINFIKTMTFLTVTGFILYKFLIKTAFNKIYLYSGIVVFSLLCIYFLYPLFVESNSAFFSWIGFFDIILLLIFLFVKKFNYDNFDKIFLILILSSILVSVKNICSITSANYGNFFFPFLFLTFVLFFYHYLPEYFPAKLKNSEYKTVFVIILFVFTALYSLSNLERRLFAFPSPVQTDKGIIYVETGKIEAINKTIDYIKQNTKEDDSILVLCEGAMINFLTSRKSNNKFYYLIPPNIQVIGEDNIVRDLKSDLPDYLVIQPMSYLNFKETFFCESFGNKICALIPQYYEYPVVFGKDFWIAVYKKKE